MDLIDHTECSPNYFLIFELRSYRDVLIPRQGTRETEHQQQQQPPDEAHLLLRRQHTRSWQGWSDSVTLTCRDIGTFRRVTFQCLYFE